MERGTIMMIIIFFLVVVAGMFGFAFMKQSQLENESATNPEELEPEVAYPMVERIDGKHYFIDGVHTVVGEIALPTPCDLLEAEAQVAGGEPEMITINFNVINNAEMCAQVITTQRFMVSAPAGNDAVFRAYFIDREIPLNLIPAAPGETPEEFELFIKG